MIPPLPTTTYRSFHRNARNVTTSTSFAYFVIEEYFHYKDQDGGSYYRSLSELHAEDDGAHPDEPEEDTVFSITGYSGAGLQHIADRPSARDALQLLADLGVLAVEVDGTPKPE